MKKLLFLLISLVAVSSFGQTILSENFGTPTATTLIPAYSTGTAPATFQSVAPITFSGTGDIRSSAPSSTYTGYSAGGNCFLTNTAGKYLQINGLNTSAYTPANINFTFENINPSFHFINFVQNYTCFWAIYRVLTFFIRILSSQCVCVYIIYIFVLRSIFYFIYIIINNFS